MTNTRFRLELGLVTKYTLIAVFMLVVVQVQAQVTDLARDPLVRYFIDGTQVHEYHINNSSKSRLVNITPEEAIKRNNNAEKQFRSLPPIQDSNDASIKRSQRLNNVPHVYRPSNKALPTMNLRKQQPPPRNTKPANPIGGLPVYPGSTR